MAASQQGATAGREAIVRQLRAADAAVNAADHEGNTLLHIPAREGHAVVVQVT